MGPATIIKKPVLSGTTHFFDLFVHAPNSPKGFKPDALTMSVYDVRWSGDDMPRRSGDLIVFPDNAVVSIVNGRDGVNVTCNDEGHAVVELTPEDTALGVPPGALSLLWRYILFTATWDTPAKVAKTQVAIQILPDREAVAT